MDSVELLPRFGPSTVAVAVRATIGAGAMMNPPPFLCHIRGLMSVITMTDEKEAM
jgi:hypothetical protein